MNKYFNTEITEKKNKTQFYAQNSAFC